VREQESLAALCAPLVAVVVSAVLVALDGHLIGQGGRADPPAGLVVPGLEGGAGGGPGGLGDGVDGRDDRSWSWDAGRSLGGLGSSRGATSLITVLLIVLSGYVDDYLGQLGMCLVLYLR
jgi:hypothetical protein